MGQNGQYYQGGSYPQQQQFQPPPPQQYQQQPYYPQPGQANWNAGVPPNGMQAAPYPNAPMPQQPVPQQPNYGAKPSEQDEMFKPAKPKWNDLFFFLLFWAHFAGFIAISVLTLRQVAGDGGSITGNASRGVTLNLNTAYLLALIAAAGFVVSIVFLLITKTFTKIILEITLALSVIFSVGYAIYLWIEKFWVRRNKSRAPLPILMYGIQSGAAIFTVL
ncbi:pH nine-sensitive protein 1 [Cystobasidiomycetes sp. EMM_F5]